VLWQHQSPLKGYLAMVVISLIKRGLVSSLKYENATVSLEWFLLDAFILFHLVPDIFIMFEIIVMLLAIDTLTPFP